GLPVEMEVQKQLGLSGPRDIEEYGIDRFIAACRALVDETADEWEFIVRRLGRWVDMENDYRTLDLTFMESVWWVFKQLWDQGRIYRSVKVLPYSWGATTPLANFEADDDAVDAARQPGGGGRRGHHLRPRGGRRRALLGRRVAGHHRLRRRGPGRGHRLRRGPRRSRLRAAVRLLRRQAGSRRLPGHPL